jgi:hypothetical protein
MPLCVFALEKYIGQSKLWQETQQNTSAVFMGDRWMSKERLHQHTVIGDILQLFVRTTLQLFARLQW